MMSDVEKPILIVYRDDDDAIKQAWVEDIRSSNGFTIFSTLAKENNSKNEVAIPNHRVIKVKRRRGEDDDESEGLFSEIN
jgi:uncharacterized protein (UPF0248 family)